MSKDISYDDKGNKFDLYPGKDENAPLLVFVHGGAWRQEDKSEHADMAERLAKQSGHTVVLPNYSLSAPENSVRHPEHAEDLLRFLQFIRSYKSFPVPVDANRLYLIGHSCGAHMIASIFCDSSKATPSLTPEPELVSAVQGIIVSGGVYDLDVLIADYPEYKDWMVGNGFGEKSDYSAYAITNYPPRDSRIKWLIIHSKGDTIVRSKQSQLFIEHLGKNVPVTVNLDGFEVEHNDITREDKYIKVVSDYVKA